MPSLVWIFSRVVKGIHISQIYLINYNVLNLLLWKWIKIRQNMDILEWASMLFVGLIYSIMTKKVIMIHNHQKI